MKQKKFLILPVLIYCIINCISDNKIFARECREGYGAFIVYDKNHPEAPVINKRHFKENIYPVLVAATFPVNTDPVISNIYYSSYNPELSDTINLERAFMRSPYRLVFLPRTLYELMYFYFVRKVEHIDLEVSMDFHAGLRWDVYNGSELNSGRVNVIRETINREPLKDAYYKFNNWALGYLREKVFEEGDLRKGVTIYLTSEKIESIVRTLYGKCLSEFSIGKEYFFLQAVEQECKVSSSTYILYQAMSEGTKAKTISMLYGDAGHTTCDPYSGSYNSGLFGGWLGGDSHASTGARFLIMDEKIKIPGFMLPLNRSSLREKKGLGNSFHVPPIPIIATLHSKGELWHPRGKVMVPETDDKRCREEDPVVRGIANLGGTAVRISKLPWLQLNRGTKWPFSEILLSSLVYEQMIRTIGINFVRPED